MTSRHRDEPPLSREWVEAFRRDTARPGQIRRAYLRFLERSRAPRRRLLGWQVAGWVLLGMVVGMSSVYAATGPLRLWRQTPREPTRQLRRAPPTVGSAHLPPAAPKPMTPEVPEVSAPASKGALPIAPSPNLGAAGAQAAARDPWQRAARSLRERDFETAHRALEELARQATGVERESAQLVQAQLLLSHGREADAVSLLQLLQASAQSPPIRQKSSELLGRIEDRPSRRAFAPTQEVEAP